MSVATQTNPMQEEDNSQFFMQYREVLGITAKDFAYYSIVIGIVPLYIYRRSISSDLTLFPLYDFFAVLNWYLTDNEIYWEAPLI